MNAIFDPSGDQTGPVFWCVRQIAVSSFVKAINFVTGFLKLDGKKIGCAGIDSSGLDARCIVAALHDLIGPKCEPIRVRFTIQKVPIVLPDEKLSVIY